MESLCVIQRVPDGIFYSEKKEKKLNLIVIRIDNKNNLVNGRPCYNCLNMMKVCGINKIYYSVDNKIICEKINNMVSINCSTSNCILEQKYYFAPNTKKLFYEKLLVNNLPKVIMLYNLKCFLEYNFYNTMSTYSYKINNNFIIFYNEKKNIVLQVEIILKN